MKMGSRVQTQTSRNNDPAKPFSFALSSLIRFVLLVIYLFAKEMDGEDFQHLESKNLQGKSEPHRFGVWLKLVVLILRLPKVM